MVSHLLTGSNTHFLGFSGLSDKFGAPAVGVGVPRGLRGPVGGGGRVDCVGRGRGPESLPVDLCEEIPSVLSLPPLNPWSVTDRSGRSFSLAKRLSSKNFLPDKNI